MNHQEHHNVVRNKIAVEEITGKVKRVGEVTGKIAGVLIPFVVDRELDNQDEGGNSEEADIAAPFAEYFIQFKEKEIFHLAPFSVILRKYSSRERLGVKPKTLIEF